MASHQIFARGRDAYVRAAQFWVGAVRRAALVVTLAAVALTGLAAVYTASELTIDTDTAAMISPELPFRQRSIAYERAFPQFVDTVVVVLDGDSVDRVADAQAALAGRLRRDTSFFRTVFAPDTDPFFARNGLLFLDTEELEDLSDRLAEAQPLLTRLARDPTLRGLFEVLGLAVDEIADGEPVPVGLTDVLARVAAVADSVANGAPKPLSWNDLMAGETSSPADRRRFITLQPKMDFTSLQPAKPAMDAIRAHARALGLDEASGIRLRLTGSAAMATEELASVSRGASLAGLISLVLVSGVLVFGLRSLRLVLAVLITLIMGLTWTAGFTTLAIGHLNLISVAFAVLFIGLAVDFGIHFGLRYKEERDRGSDQTEALHEATGGIAGALGLCTLAAAASFYAFVPTDYDGLSELGLIAGTGMFIALFANLTVLPALLTLMPVAPGTATQRQSRGFENFVGRHGRAISLAALALGVAAAASLPWARFDFNPVALKDPSTESVRTFLELMQDSKTAPYTIQALAPDLDAAARETRRIEPLAEVDRSVTLADFVPADQEDKLAAIDDMAIFLMPLLRPASAPPAPVNRRAVTAGFGRRLDALDRSSAPQDFRRRARGLAEALAPIARDAEALAGFEHALMLFLPGRLDRLRKALEAEAFGPDDLPAQIRQRYIAADGTARIEVFPAENVNDNRALRRFVDAVSGVAPTATGTPVEIVESGRVVVGAVRNAAYIALAAITLMLLAVLGSLAKSLLVLVPLALAALLTVASSVVLDLPFNFANVIVLPLLAGLGVASGIHLVIRARDGGWSIAMLQTSTPRAVVLSALTTIGSFGSLSISSHRGTSSMGELLTIAIAFTLICTLVVLPALMTWMAPEKAPGDGNEAG